MEPGRSVATCGQAWRAFPPAIARGLCPTTIDSRTALVPWGRPRQKSRLHCPAPVRSPNVAEVRTPIDGARESPSLGNEGSPRHDHDDVRAELKGLGRRPLGPDPSRHSTHRGPAAPRQYLRTTGMSKPPRPKTVAGRPSQD